MIIIKNGAEFCFGGETYRIGDRVYANDLSIFEGLYGVIAEIRTDTGEGTENETPDILCCFDIPVLPQEREKIEQQFLHLYQEEKKIEELLADMVVMKPEMLQVLTVFRPDIRKLKLVYLYEDWANDGDYGQAIDVFLDYHAAKSELCSRFSEEKSNGLIDQWQDRGDFCEECNSDQYECWLDGMYCEYHYKLSITCVEVCAPDSALSELYSIYLNESRHEDFISQVMEWDEVNKLPAERYDQFIHDPQIPALIQHHLERNDLYWESYWNSVSEVAHTLLNQYLPCEEKPVC